MSLEYAWLFAVAILSVVRLDRGTTAIYVALKPPAWKVSSVLNVMCITAPLDVMGWNRVTLSAPFVVLWPRRLI